MKTLFLLFLICFAIPLANAANQDKTTRASSNGYLKEGIHYVKKIPPDNARALELFKKSCAENNKNGCYNLGFSYYKGEGTAINYEEAKKWFEKGLQLNDAESAYILGLIYHYEEPKDYDKAQYYFEKSIELGITEQKK